MKRNDLILLVMVVIAAAISFGALEWYRLSHASSHSIAVITQNQSVVERIDLDKVSQPREIKLGGSYAETIRVEKGRIRFVQADCPDKICVNTGWLEEPGDIAVCLPNRAVIRIEE